MDNLNCGHGVGFDGNLTDLWVGVKPWWQAYITR